MSIENVPNILQELGEIYSQVDLFGVVLIGHCLFAAGLAPQLKDRFLVHYGGTFLGGFSGSIVSALLIMNPEIAPIAVFTKNSVAVTFTVCWWLRTYAPLGIVDRVLRLFPFSTGIKGMSNFVKCQLVFARVNLAVKLFPGVFAAPLILGTLSGTSGKLVLDLVFYSQQVLQGPPEVVVPTFLLRSGFMITLLYFMVVHVFAILPQIQANAMITTFFVLHGVLQDLVGYPLDVTYPVAKLVHVVSNIPEPKFVVNKKQQNGKDSDAKKND